MKTMFTKQLSAFRVSFKNINDMVSLKGGRRMIRIATMLLPALSLSTTRAKVRCIVVFLRVIYILFKHNGAKGVCLTLKVYAVILQQSIGGHVVRDLTELKVRVSRTRKGLPRIIPRVHREMIRNGDTGLIKLYLSLFNFYRLIEFKGDKRFVTLTKSIVSPLVSGPGFDILKSELLKFIPIFYKALSRQIGMNPKALRSELASLYGELKPFAILKASPFTSPLHKLEGLSTSEVDRQAETLPIVSTHPLAIHEAANALENNAELHEPIHYFLGLLPQGHILRKAWRMCCQYPISKGSGTQRAFTPVLGKLSLKEEAAGKVRVFAIVDPWTQWLLKPLHTLIFDSILSGIPSDGTKDQLKPIFRLLKEAPSSLFSYDLSAATDRLPVWLQEALLGPITGEDYSSYWRILLTSRDYVLTLQSKDNSYTPNPGVPRRLVPHRYRLRYAVGQPMGALSSWAMLAFTHHFIVQYCAWTVWGDDYVWFNDYAVLGDDIVIANPKVGKAYLRVMKTLGVGIGLHKSLISPAGTALEFAKRTFYLGVDVSPIPLLELKASLGSPAAAVQFCLKYNLTLPLFVKVCGFGFNVLGGLNKPLGKLNSKVRLIILALNTPFTVEAVESFFNLGRPKSGRSLWESMEVITAMVDKEFKLINRAINAGLHSLLSFDTGHINAKAMARVLLDRLDKSVIDTTEEMLPMVRWAESLSNPDVRYSQWVKGDGFFMSPVNYNLGGAFSTELLVADANPDIVLRGVLRLYDESLIKDLVPLMKMLQAMIKEVPNARAIEIFTSAKKDVRDAMLAKYELTASAMYMTLIAVSKTIALAPMGSLKYSRLIDAPGAKFSDGMHIRLWKALSGIAQGTQTKNAKPLGQVPEFKGWW